MQKITFNIQHQASSQSKLNGGHMSVFGSLTSTQAEFNRTSTKFEFDQSLNILRRYVELMNGMIDTEEDVRLLRVAGVVVSHMKSDGEVAGLWNGMGRSLRLTKVEGLDMVIADLNRFYGESWRTRVRRVVKYVYGWWPLLTLLAANLIILMSTLQAFCTVYDCKGSND